MDLYNSDLVRTDSRVSDFPVDSVFQELMKEVIKGQLKEQSGLGYLQSCEALKVIIKNIIEHKDDERYRVIYIRNQRFHNTIGNYPAGLLVLDLAGFTKVEDSNPFYIYNNENLHQLKE